VSEREALVIARAQQGDHAAFEQLVDGYAHYVYNLALRLLHDPHEAENLAQEAFLRAWRGLPGFRGQASFSTWLYQIVTNLYYSRLPRLRRELSALEAEEEAYGIADQRPAIDANLLTKEMQRILHRSIEQLSESYRLLITLRYLQEMSYDQIAQVTGLPLGTVKTGIHRARRLLRVALERYQAGEERYGRERITG
jgi:RNA polymerase sigma-70 factor (ECF subfamily)